MDVFITKAAKFFPNEPVGNDDMESFLGMIDGKPSKARRIVLRSNGIQQRYYALDKEGNVIRDFKKSKMYMVRVEIVTGHPEEEYEDLKKKLAELYGEGKEKIEDISGKTTTSDGVSTPFERKLTRYTVQGSNKATILMETYTNNGVCYSLFLYYVEKGADKRLDALVEAMAKE